MSNEQIHNSISAHLSKGDYVYGTRSTRTIKGSCLNDEGGLLLYDGVNWLPKDHYFYSQGIYVLDSSTFERIEEFA